jgi:hypothetical protein
MRSRTRGSSVRFILHNIHTFIFSGSSVTREMKIERGVSQQRFLRRFIQTTIYSGSPNILRRNTRTQPPTSLWKANQGKQANKQKPGYKQKVLFTACFSLVTCLSIFPLWICRRISRWVKQWIRWDGDWIVHSLIWFALPDVSLQELTKVMANYSSLRDEIP